MFTLKTFSPYSSRGKMDAGRVPKAKDKISTQMGTQIHATDNYRRAVELVQAGAAGKIKEAHVWCGRTIKPVGEEVLPEQPVPDGFNWETWLGPAPDRAYNQGYWKGGNLNWNRRWDFVTEFLEIWAAI